VRTTAQISVNIFEFDDAVEFLRAVFEKRRKLSPSYSLRAWCRTIGFRNPSFLSEILRGVRKLTIRTSNRIAASLKLPGEQKRFFDLLVLKGSAKTMAERDLYAALLEGLHPLEKCLKLDLDTFRAIADWHHFALLEMIELRDFKRDARYLSGRLKDRISPKEVEEALSRLLRLELLKVTEEGRLRRGKGHPHTGDGRPDGAIRRHHRQMIDLAKSAMISDPIQTRDIRGSMTALTEAGYAEAVKLIQQCHRQIQKLETLDTAQEVYRFNTQFFCLTGSANKDFVNK